LQHYLLLLQLQLVPQLFQINVRLVTLTMELIVTPVKQAITSFHKPVKLALLSTLIVPLVLLLVYALPVWVHESPAKTEKLVFLIAVLSTWIVWLVLLMVNALPVWVHESPAKTEKLVFLIAVLSTLIVLLVLMVNALPVLV